MINPFHHNVNGNRMLRDSLPVIRQQIDTNFNQCPPLPIDCLYFVKAWKKLRRDLSENLTHQQRL